MKSANDVVIYDNPPTCEVKVSLDRPLLSASQVEASNLISVTPMGIFSCPVDGWHLSSQAPTQTYGLSVPLPMGDADRVLTFNDGVLVPASKDCSVIDGNCNPYEGEQGLLRGKDDIVFRNEAEQTKNRIEFRSSKAIYVDSSAVAGMISEIPKHRLVPVELKRHTIEAEKSGKGVKGGKGKGSGEEDSVPGCHGVAYVDISSLLYPGATQITGAFPVVPYDDAEMLEKTGRSRELLDELIAPPGKKKRDAKKEAAQAEVAIAEGAAYADSRTYILLRIVLAEPLVAKRTINDYVGSVAALVPPRELYPKSSGGAAKALVNFHTQIEEVAHQLLDGFRQHSKTAGIGSEEDLTQVRTSLVYELNNSGKYYAFKEQLKRAIVKIVREKFLKTHAITDPVKRERFISDLYMFLIDEVHDVLNDQFSFDAIDNPKPIEVNIDHLQYFAREAEARELFDSASTFHQECIARGRNNVSCWYGYGCFCMRVGDYAKAEECFREAVSIDTQDAPSLLMAATVAWMNDKLDVANVLFEAATNFDFENGVVWALRGMYHHLAGDSISSEMCLETALKTDSDEPGAGVFLKTAKVLLNINVSVLIESALSRELVAHGVTVDYQLVLAEHLLNQGKFEEAATILAKASEIQYSNKELLAVEGHIYFKMQNYDLAILKYEHCLDLPGETTHADIVRLRLGKLYIEQGNYAKVRALFLAACHAQPSATTWEGVGIACYHMDNLEDAEVALAESNLYDNRNPTVWGYLALIALRTGRVVEAEEAYKFALTQGLTDSKLLKAIRVLQENTGFGNPFVDS